VGSKKWCPLPSGQTMSIHVRLAQSADLAVLADLFNQYRQFYEQADDLAAAYAFLQQRFEQQQSTVLLAMDNMPDGAQVVGFCQLYPSFCSVALTNIEVLYDLFVLPATRGQGVGRALLLAAENRAAQQGIGRLDLTTAHTNLTAQALYESLGWVQDLTFRTYTRHIVSAAKND
jgi:ribosomal protein S18 acetylase RimI-like enzyme